MRASGSGARSSAPSSGRSSAPGTGPFVSGSGHPAGEVGDAGRSRQFLEALVEGFEARSVREQVSRDRFLSELSRLDDPFAHDGQLVHVTGSALVLGQRGTVLHVHRKLGIWLQPGGHVDPGETVADAALRETVEETGLPVRHPRSGPRLLHLDVHPGPSSHLHLDLRYLLLSPDVDPAPPAGESQQVRWWSLDEAAAIADEGLVDGVRRLARISAAERLG